MAWMDMKGAIVADTVYADGKLVAKDVGFTLPGVSLQTGDVQAMGTMSVPSWDCSTTWNWRSLRSASTSA